MLAVVTEVLDFDPAFVDQGFEAVIQTAHTHSNFFSQLSLRYVGAVVQNAHDPVVIVFLLVGLAAKTTAVTMRVTAVR